MIAPLGAGSISLRLYPHPLAPVEIVEEMRAQAALAEHSGFDGVMVAEHHGGFAGYLPNPLQMAGWLLEATKRAWAAPCPLLLPLRHWTHVAEELAWLACRFPGRVAAGFGSGGLALDFELVELEFARSRQIFRDALPRLVEALRGHVAGPLASDRAIAACRDHPVPVVSAAQGPRGVRHAAKLGMGVLFDSLQGPARIRELAEMHRQAGGDGALIGIRRVWLGPPPRSSVDGQMDFYRSYASAQAQSSWGSDELVGGDDAAELADNLASFARHSGCDALNLRVHLQGIEPARVREQIERIGSEALPLLREALERPSA